MPHYFFPVYQAGRKVDDTEGTACHDLSAAKDYAVESARELANQAIGSGIPPSTLCVEIVDDAGRTLAALTIAEVIEHPAAPSFKPNC
jgi:hypothetical protein